MGRFGRNQESDRCGPAGLASLPAPRAQAPAPPAARRRGHGRPSARKGQEEEEERVGELHSFMGAEGREEMDGSGDLG